MRFLGVCIVIAILVFIVPLDSQASERWEKQFFKSFGLGLGY